MNAKYLETEAETKQIAIRLPVALLDRVKAHATRLKRSAPGVLGVTRADAIRALLHDALEDAERRENEKQTRPKA